MRVERLNKKIVVQLGTEKIQIKIPITFVAYREFYEKISPFCAFCRIEVKIISSSMLNFMHILLNFIINLLVFKKKKITTSVLDKTEKLFIPTYI